MKRSLIGLALTAACGAGPTPPVEPVSAQEATPVARCAVLAEPEWRSWPSLGEISAVLGEPLDSPAVDRLAERLGAPDKAPLYQIFDGPGLELHGAGYGLDIRVARVLLRNDPSRRYGGALPDGLRFSDNRGELLRRFGPGDLPAGCEQGTGPCLYLDRGFVVDASDASGGCVRAVALFRPIPRGGALIDEVTVRSVDRDMRGVEVRIHARFGALPPDRSWQVALRLRTAAGQPVAEADWVGRARGAGSPIALEREIDPGSPGPDGWETIVFVPHVALDLPAGENDLVADVIARTALRGEPESRSEPIAATATPCALDMPPVTQVRFAVRELVVAPGEYDFDGVRHSWLNRPDLTWRVSYGDHEVYRSATRTGLRGRWDRPTPWLRVARGDRLIVRFEDADLVVADWLGEVALDPDRLRALAGSIVRPGGRIVRLRLGSVQQRPVPAPRRARNR